MSEPGGAEGYDCWRTNSEALNGKNKAVSKSKMTQVFLFHRTLCVRLEFANSGKGAKSSIVAKRISSNFVGSVISFGTITLLTSLVDHFQEHFRA